MEEVPGSVTVLALVAFAIFVFFVLPLAWNVGLVPVFTFLPEVSWYFFACLYAVSIGFSLVLRIIKYVGIKD